MTALLNKKRILTGILVILSLMIVGSFFFTIKTTGKVISGGSTTCHCLAINPDGSIDYDQKKDVFINCTIEYTTWYGSTYTFECNRTVRMPYSQMQLFNSGDSVKIEYNPLFPWLARLS